MNRYIALLRGINVGGKNKIAMPALRAAFEKTGFSNVSTYINSGNVLFSAEDSRLPALAQTCEAAILTAFGLAITVCVISADALAEALAHAPNWWDQDPACKHNAIFAIPPASTEEILLDIGQIKPEYEKLAAHGQVIFWSAPLETFSRTRLSKVVSAPAYQSVTIRNANTAKKLAQLAEGV